MTGSCLRGRQQPGARHTGPWFRPRTELAAVGAARHGRLWPAAITAAGDRFLRG